jgi:hypothetical protein
MEGIVTRQGEDAPPKADGFRRARPKPVSLANTPRNAVKNSRTRKNRVKSSPMRPTKTGKTGEETVDVSPPSSAPETPRDASYVGSRISTDFVYWQETAHEPQSLQSRIAEKSSEFNYKLFFGSKPQHKPTPAQLKAMFEATADFVKQAEEIGKVYSGLVGYNAPAAPARAHETYTPEADTPADELFWRTLVARSLGRAPETKTPAALDGRHEEKLASHTDDNRAKLAQDTAHEAPAETPRDAPYVAFQISANVTFPYSPKPTHKLQSLQSRIVQKFPRFNYKLFFGSKPQHKPTPAQLKAMAEWAEQTEEVAKEYSALARECFESNSHNLTVNKLDLGYNDPATPERAPETETPPALDVRWQEDERLVKEPKRKTLSSKLDALLASEGVARDARPALIAEMRRMVARVKSQHPRWLGRKERGGELARLTAPLFLKRVYADKIAADGTVHKDVIRALDSDLMDAVETYISTRARRGHDLGDASGLNFVVSRPPTNAIHAIAPKGKTSSLA